MLEFSCLDVVTRRYHRTCTTMVSETSPTSTWGLDDDTVWAPLDGSCVLLYQYSPVVIDAMSRRHADKSMGCEWSKNAILADLWAPERIGQEMDIRDLRFNPSSFDIALDKGRPLSLLNDVGWILNPAYRYYGRYDDRQGKCLGPTSTSCRGLHQRDWWSDQVCFVDQGRLRLAFSSFTDDLTQSAQQTARCIHIHHFWTAAF